MYESCSYTQHLYNEVFGNNEELQTAVALGYAEDPLFSKVSQRLAEFPAFEKEGNFLWGKNRGGESVLCVPNAKLGTKTVRGAILEQAHEIVGHFGPQRTINYVLVAQNDEGCDSVL